MFTAPCADMTTHSIDWLCAHTMAIVVGCRAILAGTCAIARVARVPGSPYDICGLVRRSRQPRWAERRVHQGHVWIL